MDENRVDGIQLLRLEEEFAHDVLKIKHTLKRRRLMRLIDRLKLHQQEHKKVSTVPRRLWSSLGCDGLVAGYYSGCAGRIHDVSGKAQAKGDKSSISLAIMSIMSWLTVGGEAKGHLRSLR